MCSEANNFTDCCNCIDRVINGCQIITSCLHICNNTCDNGFYLSRCNPENVKSTYWPVVTTVKTSENTMTATILKNSTTVIPSQISTDLSPSEISTTATVEEFGICMACHNICLTCNGSNTSCLQCRYSFNGSCVEKCPKDYAAKEGENCTQINLENNEPSQKTLAIIIGASVGGSVALIAVIIIVIVFCFRRRRNRDPTSRNNRSVRTAMSGILQGRTEGGEKRDDDATESTSPHPIYENVERPNALGNQIQEQGDKILRYARDPTMMDKKKEPKETDPTRSSSYYENSSTIRRQNNIHDIKGVSGEQVELEQLGQAPLPPTSGKKKSKKSLKSRMSQKIKQLRGNVPPQAPPVSDQETQEEHYLPMGPSCSQSELLVNNETSTDNQEVYEEMEDKSHHQPPTLFTQENYENVEDILADVPSVIAPPPPPVEQEDYENIKDKFSVPERARTGQKSKGRMPDPPSIGSSRKPKGRMPDPPSIGRSQKSKGRMPDTSTEAKISSTSPGSGDDKLSKDYINVEKYRRSGPESSKKDDSTSKETQEELEDYENIKHFSKK
ncbi:hypothetical protein CHS0354_015366 [Potamilus streckersoni]|nr:hypothetical protein CHS0354_015366 [Potamilus streckersoni]